MHGFNKPNRHKQDQTIGNRIGRKRKGGKGRGRKGRGKGHNLKL